MKNEDMGEAENIVSGIINEVIDQISIKDDEITVKPGKLRGTVVETCPICGQHASKQESIKCSTCNSLVHNSCTQLPIYMIHTFNRKKTKKFECEQCTEKVEGISFAEKQQTSARIGENVANHTPEGIVPCPTQSRFSDLEEKVERMYLSLEKFDFVGLSENIDHIFNKLSNSQQNANECLNRLKKLESGMPNTSIQTTSAECTRCDSRLQEDLMAARKDAKSFQASYELLLETIKERDDEIRNFNGWRSKTIDALQEKNNKIVRLNEELKQASEAVPKMMNEISTLTISRDDILKKWEVDKLRMATLEGEVTRLQSNLADTSEQGINERSRQGYNASTETDEDVNDAGEKKDVIILHDSLCRRINESILSREGIQTSKIWAPDLEKMSESLDEMEDSSARVIVLEALTRDLSTLTADQVMEKSREVIEKAKLKADRVVLSSIIRRDDDEQHSAKADIVNGTLKYSYATDEEVLICDNGNLFDPKFRYDKLHLTSHGVAVFATNLKHKIAEGLGIRVQRKERRGDYNQERGRDNRDRGYQSNRYTGGDRYNNRGERGGRNPYGSRWDREEGQWSGW